MSSLLETFREILAQHDLLPETFLRTGICIAVRHGTKRTSATAHILLIRTGPRLSGGATGRQAIRGPSTRKANGHFLLLSCRHGTGGSRPCGNSVTKNAPGVMQRRRSRHTSVYRHPFPVQRGTRT